MTRQWKTLVLVLAAAASGGVLLSGAERAGAAHPGANGKIAFARVVAGGSEIFVIDPDGANQTQLTRNSVADGTPSWSPDGAKIAFFRDFGFPNTEIVVMNADGSGETQLTAHPSRDESPSWSPDGSRVVFWSDRDGDAEIFVVNADGTGLTQLTTNRVADAYPAWSPDGARIAYSSAADGNFEIYVMDADGSRQTQLTSTDLLGNLHPDWSPDGAKIAFSRSHQGAGIGGIWATSPDGSGQTQLTAGLLDDFPAWAPDGTKIAFRATGIGIAVMNADGSAVTPLTAATSDGAPDWQPVVTQTAFADLALTLETSANKANTKKPFGYTITVENRGPAPAAGVVVTDVLDPNARFSSVTTSRGACTPPAVGASGSVTCDLGGLPVSESAEIVVVVELPSRNEFGSATPSVSNTASAGGSTADPVVGNNAARVLTDVVGP
jgi:uncharacterized repeat protein (TIGR01451 family)